MKTSQTLRKSNRRLLFRLVLLTAGMFGFGYALVPLYSVICEITGLNGKTGVVEAESLDGVVDMSREITVQFIGSVNSGLSWEFHPVMKSMRVHPGQLYETRYYAKNLTDKTVTGQAVPSVTPAVASKYFNKTECFCFTQQTFGARESREMPVRFVIGTKIPKDVSTVTLSYTFFNTNEKT